MRTRTLLAMLALSLPLVLLASSAEAQTATPNSRLGWTQEAPSLAAAQGYEYEASFDGGGAGVLSNVVCAAGGAPTEFSCAADFPPLTPASHTVTLRAVLVTGTTRTPGPMSAAFTFTFVALPAAPSNLRIVPGL